ncbi:hypothetical protein N431DRAFT_465223 [Stipitochalara longipes BDJ]|nr:hypothetical protein N431DRAFT_465223 [Stipitochalara longipes BDJ]
MARKLMNPLPPGSDLKLCMLPDSSIIAPIINALKAKYRKDSTGNYFPLSKPITIGVFHHPHSKDYELYRSSLLKITQSHGQFPVVFAKPFMTNTRQNKAFGFNTLSPEVITLRNDLAKHFDTFMENQTLRAAKDRNILHKNNGWFHLKIMFIYGVAAHRSEQIQYQLKQQFPAAVATLTALGFRLLDMANTRSRAEEEFLFQK